VPSPPFTGRVDQLPPCPPCAWIPLSALSPPGWGTGRPHLQRLSSPELAPSTEWPLRSMILQCCSVYKSLLPLPPQTVNTQGQDLSCVIVVWEDRSSNVLPAPQTSRTMTDSVELPPCCPRPAGRSLQNTPSCRPQVIPAPPGRRKLAGQWAVTGAG
jgi:hypothetical protein